MSGVCTVCGAAVQLWTCNGQSNQKWTFASDPQWSRRRESRSSPAAGGFRGHTATIDHSLLGLELGDHMMVVDPIVVLPAPSSAVPVPRLTMW
jgi:hypothetical protein